MKNIKELYETHNLGDPLSDEELIALRDHMEKLEELARAVGPVFQLAANEAGRLVRSLDGFAKARGLK